jgi:hypothetical protein
MTKLVLDWQNGDEAVGPDGTAYMIQSEHPRGERRFYFALFLAPGLQRNDRNWKAIPFGDGGHDKRTQRTRCRRHAEQRQREMGSS